MPSFCESNLDQKTLANSSFSQQNIYCSTFSTCSCTSHKSIVDLDACTGDELYKLQVPISCIVGMYSRRKRFVKGRKTDDSLAITRISKSAKANMTKAVVAGERV